MWHLLSLSKPNSKEDKKLVTAIKTIAGITPGNLALYKLATLHSSRGKEKNGFRESNERLEYLGDAILGAAVADYLFKKYPFKDEGFLTEIRSRIVNRESLNNLAKKMGIAAIVQFDQKNIQLQKVILGNTLEALVGAIYLDKGYLRTKKFVIDKLIQPYFDLEVVVSSNSNHKSKLIEWTQRESKEIRFDVEEIKKGRNQREFAAQVFIADQPFGQGFGLTKKKAEQDAAEKTCIMLQI
ncbi:MAG: ribonuclease III [Cyclobacteriaceae bacterium]|nr:ribonuclease III [Cytophagales bacterium]MBX2899933.1 ribonuclease III [Cyclobacteriaceae bacterium]